MFTYMKNNLIDSPRVYKKILIIFNDIFICILSVWLTFLLILDQWKFMSGKQWWLLIASVTLFLYLINHFSLYREITRYFGFYAFTVIIRLFLYYSLFIFLVFTLIGIEGIPRSTGIIQPLLLFIGLSLSRYLVRFWFGGFVKLNNDSLGYQAIILVYGAGSAGRQFVAAISSNNNILVRGFVDDDKALQGNCINGIYIYHSDQLANLIIKFKISDIVLAIPSVNHNRRIEIISSLYNYQVRVRTLPRIFDFSHDSKFLSKLLDLDMNDLLGREVVAPDFKLLQKNITNRVVLVTGGGGSIGSELCRQIIKLSPISLIIIDNSEPSLHLIYEELKISTFCDDKDLAHQHASSNKSYINIIPILASVCDKKLLSRIFSTHRPEIVFHAAAYKHVPLLEQNQAEGIRNNVYGTLNCAVVSLTCGVKNFVLVSTDKSVRPTSVMGASKRVSEMVLQALADHSLKTGQLTIFSMVRFGNVLGSSGSVAPLFRKQIENGGPVTLTHRDVTRFFMTIPEAAQLMIQASAMAAGGDVFILDMGKPVRIYDLAVSMIKQSGLMVRNQRNPRGDIEIIVTGLRPGEKLFEELMLGNNPKPTDHPKIMKANEDFIPWSKFESELEKLNCALLEDNKNSIGLILKQLVPDFKPNIADNKINLVEHVSR